MPQISSHFPQSIKGADRFIGKRRTRRMVLASGLAATLFLTAFPGVGRATDIPTKITVGVGGVSNTYDGTSESFNLVTFLQARRHPANSPAVEFLLVDHPIDADYAVSGKVTASYDHQHRGGGVGRSNGKPHVFTYTNALDLAVWRKGKKIAVLKAEPNSLPSDLSRELVQGSIEADSYDGIRTKLLQPVWQELANRIDQQVQADLTKTGEK